MELRERSGISEMSYVGDTSIVCQEQKKCKITKVLQLLFINCCPCGVMPVGTVT